MHPIIAAQKKEANAIEPEVSAPEALKFEN